MGVKADIGWTTEHPEGGKRHVYARKKGREWLFFERPKRRGTDIQWLPIETPAFDDWLELLDALERGQVRRRYMPDDVKELRQHIRELFPDQPLPASTAD